MASGLGKFTGCKYIVPDIELNSTIILNNKKSKSLKWFCIQNILILLLIIVIIIRI